MNGERDHVHLWVNLPPDVSVAKLVNSLKGRIEPSASKAIAGRGRKKLRILPVVAFVSYFAAGCGGAPLSIIKTYLGNQETPG